MNIFLPSTIYCPFCNASADKYIGHNRSEYTLLDNGHYTSSFCKHEFSLFDSLSSQIDNYFGILNAFSHWNVIENKYLTIGTLNRIAIKLPPGYALYSAIVTPHVISEDDFYLYDILSVNREYVTISTYTHNDSNTNILGSKRDITFSAYAYNTLRKPNYYCLLYESIKDLCEKRFTLSVVKLATFIEMFCDSTLSKYLKCKTIQDAFSIKFIKNLRNWDSRYEYLSMIANEFLEDPEIHFLKSTKNSFTNLVRNPRNNFSHSFPPSISMQECLQAFRSSFPIIWALDSINTKLIHDI